eukprot:CAMPEP_0118866722 /NCGR_PEP_ID=MMETSP1163-20130328/10535_1 /TAXON_ID=124430 /ORGANISM="Phaeomonas parva, Strain CCMP2877" /LENGTH=110 /DNA_ID=CAMNT_0006801065 /DNA_START=77 /DNA_END=405 /DNA_ORIENTATION=+
MEEDNKEEARVRRAIEAALGRSVESLSLEPCARPWGNEGQAAVDRVTMRVRRADRDADDERGAEAVVVIAKHGTVPRALKGDRAKANDKLRSFATEAAVLELLAPHFGGG